MYKSYKEKAVEDLEVQESKDLHGKITITETAIKNSTLKWLKEFIQLECNMLAKELYAEAIKLRKNESSSSV